MYPLVDSTSHVSRKIYNTLQVGLCTCKGAVPVLGDSILSRDRHMADVDISGVKIQHFCLYLYWQLWTLPHCLEPPEFTEGVGDLKLNISM